MSQINSTGTYRGKIVDHGVGATQKSNIPQWIASLTATERWDEETGQWVDWSGYEETEITAYLCLFDKKINKCLNCTQVEKVTGWDGCDLQELSELDLSATGIQFRIETNTYVDDSGQTKSSLQVAWIDEYDAAPGRTVRKLDPAELKKLNAKYSKAMKPKTKPATAASPKAAPKAPSRAPGIIEQKTTKAPEAPAASSDLPAGKCTHDEAWEQCVDLKAKGVTDEQLATTWVAAAKEIAPKTIEKKITEEQWFQIKELVLEKTAMF